MSQPNDNHNNNKRSAHNTTTTSGCGDGYLPPAMKKAKSQAVASSLDGNKNGIPFHFDTTDLVDPSSPIIEEDPASPNYDAVCQGSPSGGVTSNLSRKKATPPHPAKKLVIKLLKGSFFASPFLLWERFRIHWCQDVSLVVGFIR